MNQRSKVKKTGTFFTGLETPVKLTWTLFFIFIVVRSMEYLSFPGRDTNQIFFNYLAGLRYDFIFASLTGALMILIFLIIPRKAHKTALNLFGVVILFFAILTWGLSEYYLSTFIPLDNSILIYPPREMIHIVSSSESISLSQIIKVIVIIVLSIGFIWFLLPRIRLSQKIIVLLTLPILIFVLVFNNITPDIVRFARNQPYYQQINKTSYFVKSLLQQLTNKKEFEEQDLLLIARDFHELRSDFYFIDPEYSFLRHNNDTDVIGQYFGFRSKEPNLVFIIVESLSRNFSGPDAKWGSFTPFLDSLTQHSLYWKNFLSTSERTFNVLPSAFASLPYASKGFMALVEDGRAYPDFVSLPEILNQTDYHYNFFYGGWAYFDYMEVFLNHMSVDYILDENKFGSTYEKMPDTGEGYSWGYPDDAVFRRSMEIIDSFPASPRMDIYMTLNMHQPFSTPDPERWQNAYTDHMKTIGTGKFGDEFYNNRQLQFSSILYTDDAIRKLLNEYRKRPEYDNTIFFILGDHHLQMHDFNPIEKYHVPLIIYSPMLNSSKVFPAVSSVADLTPTIATMMEKNFEIKVPDKIHWLGSTLDTHEKFRSRSFIPFMRINRQINELLSNEYFYSEGRLFKIDEEMNIKPSENLTQRILLNEKLRYFNILNDYVCNENKIYNYRHE